MNKIILTNRLDPQDNSNKKEKIFFVIGKMNEASTKNKLIDLLYELNIIDSAKCTLKYNGIELYIRIQEIPKIVKKISNENILIYSIYQTYDPGVSI